MQPISINAYPSAASLLAGGVDSAKAIEEMARQINTQASSQIGTVHPGVGPAVQPMPTQPAEGGVFDSVLGKFVHEVNDKHVQMGNSLQGMLAGENVPLHQVMTEFQEAGVAFTMMVELRNKMLESYKEMMAMQI